MDENENLCLKTDVLLSADVFAKFRNLCKECYRLQPWHYFSSPRLSQDAVRKMTDVKLDLIIDIDMY